LPFFFWLSFAEVINASKPKIVWERHVRRVTPFLTLSVLLISLIWMVSAPSPSASTVVRFDPAAIELGPEYCVGETFTLAAKIDDVEYLTGVGIQIKWNTTYLEYVEHILKIPVEDYADGVLHEPILFIADTVNAVQGTYDCATASLGGPTFNGSGTVFEITFRVKYQPIAPEPDAHFQVKFTLHDLADLWPCGGIPHYIEHCNVTIHAAEYTQLTVNSIPEGVPLTANGTLHTTPWIGNFSLYDVVDLVLPETHIVGPGEYYWSDWEDNVTNRARTVIMNTYITLTAHYEGPYYDLIVDSIPVSNVPFTINGAPKTTLYTEYLLDEFYFLVMPETYEGYTWSHWLEDGDTNRMKTVIFPNTVYTAVYLPPPVGGATVPINSAKFFSWTASTLLLFSLVFSSSIYIKRRNKTKHS